jgi:hypothetical protein
MPHKKGAPADWRAELWARLCDIDICAEAFGSDDFIMTKDGPVLLRDQARLDAETHAKLEDFARIFHRKRSAVLRHIMQGGGCSLRARDYC